MIALLGSTSSQSKTFCSDSTNCFRKVSNTSKASVALASSASVLANSWRISNSSNNSSKLTTVFTTSSRTDFSFCILVALSESSQKASKASRSWIVANLSNFLSTSKWPPKKY